MKKFPKIFKAIRSPLSQERININTIYVELLNEGTQVFRPAQAKMLKKSIYQILLNNDYDSEDETWKFVPGSIVEVECQILKGEKVLVAKKKVEL